MIWVMKCRDSRQSMRPRRSIYCLRVMPSMSSMTIYSVSGVGGHIVDGDNVGVAELGHGLGLVMEAAAEIGILRQVALEYFNGDQTVQPVTASLVDVGHTA